MVSEMLGSSVVQLETAAAGPNHCDVPGEAAEFNTEALAIC